MRPFYLSAILLLLWACSPEPNAKPAADTAQTSAATTNSSRETLAAEQPSDTSAATSVSASDNPSDAASSATTSAASTTSKQKKPIYNKVETPQTEEKQQADAKPQAEAKTRQQTNTSNKQQANAKNKQQGKQQSGTKNKKQTQQQAKQQTKQQNQQQTEQPAEPKKESPRRYIALKTNIVYDAFLIPNLAFEMQVGRHLSVELPVMWSFWDVQQEHGIRVVALQPELRWWTGDEVGKGHFIGLHAHAAWYNVKWNETRYQSNPRPLLGAGLSYGYKLPLSRHWGAEFTLGLGYANMKYRTYHNVENGAYKDTRVRNYWGVTRLGASLVYRF